jgi:predicted TIM-barrel fold metal-dependent hydrolase
VEWAAAAGLKGINLPAPRADFRPYNEAVWEPLWAACESVALPLTTHNGGGDLTVYRGVEGPALGSIETSFFARRHTWVMILGGVFERHPRLKLVLTEQWAEWIPEMLADMDSVYFAAHFHELREALPKPPSEYWLRNCYVGASFMSEAEARFGIEYGIVDRLLWGADYPHIEGAWTRTRQSIRKTYSTIPAEHVRKYLGQNAIGVYGFDRSKLAELANKIGPTVEEIATPCELPADKFLGYAFRDRGKFS